MVKLSKRSLMGLKSSLTIDMLSPIIATCGTTGVGKSKLAIELALKLSQRALGPSRWSGARIINADAMQVYAGMDILTNKVPESERQGVEHLLMGYKLPGEQYVVGQWVQDAIRVVRVFLSAARSTNLTVLRCSENEDQRDSCS